MAKRFIDTELFGDEWFSELSQDGKMFFIYYITTCDHAGILRLNRRLCTFQTGINDIERVVVELGKTLYRVKENVFFMPKFIKFQYPKFPISKVHQQDSAIKILVSYGLWDEANSAYSQQVEEYMKSTTTVWQEFAKRIERVKEELTKTYDNGNDNDSVLLSSNISTSNTDLSILQIDDESDSKKNIQKETEFELLKIFDKFRKKYPGTKRGAEIEFDNLKKKYKKEFKTIIPILEQELDRQFAERTKKMTAGNFVPEWKNLQTYINNRAWEETFNQGAENSVKSKTNPMDTPAVVKRATGEVRFGGAKN